MTLFIKFDVGDVTLIKNLLYRGLAGYSVDSLVPRGMSTVWLLLADNSILKIHTKMNDAAAWNEVGTLVFRQVGKSEPAPPILPLPNEWRNISNIEKLLFENDEFTAENGLKITNVLDEEFIITCSENICQIEIKAPFFRGGFLPEYYFEYYKQLPM